MDARTAPRRHAPRARSTTVHYLNAVRPLLLTWAERYDHLREVTREDIMAALEPLHGDQRHIVLVALRSLFAATKKNGTVFRNPTSRIHVGQRAARVLQPLTTDHVERSMAAAIRPADPLILALASIHAPRAGGIRDLLLDDIDLSNRRLTIAGRTRPLDEMTRRALLHWLDYRRARWPATANPHLLVNMRTAPTTGSVSSYWLNDTFRGHHATLDRLRMDRQLEEALAHRADPLHLALVFGIDEKPAIRYANSARQLLETSIESDAAG
jgi:integrase